MTSISASVDSSYNNPLNQQPLPEGKGCATGIEELKVGNFLKISNAPPQYNTPEDMNAYWGEVRCSRLLLAASAGDPGGGARRLCVLNHCLPRLFVVFFVFPVCSVSPVSPCVCCSSQRYLHPTPSTTPPPVRRAIHSRNPGPRPRRARQTIRHVDQRPGVSSGI